MRILQCSETEQAAAQPANDTEAEPLAPGLCETQSAEDGEKASCWSSQAGQTQDK